MNVTASNAGLVSRLSGPGPKRILSLDGGGIRGLITLGFLARIEYVLRERHKNPSLKLCDYFDLIGGTSTGAIIAAGLALGFDVAHITNLYLNLGRRAFGTTLWNKFRAWYQVRPLEEELQHVFGERRLDSPDIKTGLCIVSKRADTGSTWPLINHPRGKYFESNCSILLRQALRASSAAPLYFIPEKLQVGKGEIGAFIDGGISLANNPALLLFCIATLRGFPFRWSVGEDRLLLVSIGTGDWRGISPAETASEAGALHWLLELPGMFIRDANRQTQMILQYLSQSPTSWLIDQEVGDLSDDLLTPQAALSYLRYDAFLEQEPLTRLGLSALISRLDSLREMSATDNMEALKIVGERAAEAQIRAEHFPQAFDMST